MLQIAPIRRIDLIGCWQMMCRDSPSGKDAQFPAMVAKTDEPTGSD
jgi:hypothetical protein